MSSPDPPQPTPPPPPLDTPKDEEAEKRRQRAARFGIPIVQPPKPGAKSLPDVRLLSHHYSHLLS